MSMSSYHRSCGEQFAFPCPTSIHHGASHPAWLSNSETTSSMGSAGFRKFNVHQQFVTWLEMGEVFAVSELMPGSGEWPLGKKSASVKVWWACRDEVTAERSGLATMCPSHPKLQIPCTWERMHGHRLLSGKLLVVTLLNSISRELATKPKRLTFCKLNNLRVVTSAVHSTESGMLAC